MQTHARATTSYELPKGYGPLVETFKVVGPDGVEGTLFVHDRDGDKPGQVASLRLKVGGHQMTFRHLWEPKTARTTDNGNVLQFRNAPNSERGEDWSSPSFRERRIEVYENEETHEVFAWVPNAPPHPTDPYKDERIAIQLKRQGAPRPKPAFNVGHFQARAQEAKAAVQGLAPREAKPAAKDEAREAREQALDAATLETVQQNEGAKGARWADVVQAVQMRDWPEGAKPSDDDVEAALNRLMDKGQVYEPTLNLVKTT